MPLKANTPLFTFVMKPANSSQLLGKQLNPKIQFRLRTLMGEGRNNPRCAYWSFGTENNNGNNRRNSPHHRGKWSTKGCEVKGVYPAQRLFTAYEYVNCTCDRVAPVTVLMDVAPSFVVFEESGLQNIFSYVGLLSSILILSTTFVILTIIRGLRTNSNDIHRNIVFCLLLVQILFMIALKFRDGLIQREVRIVPRRFSFSFFSTFSFPHFVSITESCIIYLWSHTYAHKCTSPKTSLLRLRNFMPLVMLASIICDNNSFSLLFLLRMILFRIYIHSYTTVSLQNGCNFSALLLRLHLFVVVG